MAIRRIPHPSAPSYGTSYGYGSYYGGSRYPSYSYAGYGDPSYGYGYSYPSYGYGSYYSPGYRVARRVAIHRVRWCAAHLADVPSSVPSCNLVPVNECGSVSRSYA